MKPAKSIETIIISLFSILLLFTPMGASANEPALETSADIMRRACDIKAELAPSENCRMFLAELVEITKGYNFLPVELRKQMPAICVPANASIDSIYKRIRPIIISNGEDCAGVCCNITFAEFALREAYPCGSVN